MSYMAKSINNYDLWFHGIQKDTLFKVTLNKLSKVLKQKQEGEEIIISI